MLRKYRRKTFRDLENVIILNCVCLSIKRDLLYTINQVRQKRLIINKFKEKDSFKNKQYTILA